MPSRAFKNLQKARALAREKPNKNGAVQQSAVQVMPVGTTPTLHATYNVGCTPPATSANLLDMSPVGRKALVHGASVKFFKNGALIGQFPRGLLSVASKTFTQIVNAINEVHLPAGIFENQVESIVDWIISTTNNNKVKPFPQTRDLPSAIRLVHAGDFLGLTQYLGGTIAFHKHSFFNKNPTHEELTTVQELSESKDDIFVRLIAERIAFLIRKGELPNKESFINAISTLRNITTAIQEINGPWEQREARKKEAVIRRAAQQHAYQQRQARQASYVRRQNVAQENLNKEAEIREVLLEKLGNKIVALTADEIYLVQRLRSQRDPAIMRFM